MLIYGHRHRLVPMIQCSSAVRPGTMWGSWQTSCCPSGVKGHAAAAECWLQLHHVDFCSHGCQISFFNLCFCFRKFVFPLFFINCSNFKKTNLWCHMKQINIPGGGQLVLFTSQCFDVGSSSDDLKIRVTWLILYIFSFLKSNKKTKTEEN